MKPRNILGVSGFAGGGKDTMGDYLVANHGYKKISFATPIKDACRDIYDFNEEQLYGDLKEEPDHRYPFTGICVKCGAQMREPIIDIDPPWSCECGWSFEHKHITPRLAMQTMGTEWGRRLFANTWIIAVFNKIQNSDHDRWVIPDVRFRNEVHAVQDRGGEAVRLLRGSMRHDHQSEREMAEMEDKEFDWIIDNRGTLEEFYEKIEEMLEIRAK